MGSIKDKSYWRRFLLEADGDPNQPVAPTTDMNGNSIGGDPNVDMGAAAPQMDTTQIPNANDQQLVGNDQIQQPQQIDPNMGNDPNTGMDPNMGGQPVDNDFLNMGNDPNAGMDPNMGGQMYTDPGMDPNAGMQTDMNGNPIGMDQGQQQPAPTDDIGKLDQEFFKDLSDEEIMSRDNKLKSSFTKLYNVATDIIDKITNIDKREDIIAITDFVVSKLRDIRTMVTDYINDIYDSKSYIENYIYYNECLAILKGLGDLLKEIEQKT